MNSGANIGYSPMDNRNLRFYEMTQINHSRLPCESKTSGPKGGSAGVPRGVNPTHAAIPNKVIVSPYSSSL